MRAISSPAGKGRANFFLNWSSISESFVLTNENLPKCSVFFSQIWDKNISSRLHGMRERAREWENEIELGRECLCEANAIFVCGSSNATISNHLSLILRESAHTQTVKNHFANLQSNSSSTHFIPCFPFGQSRKLIVSVRMEWNKTK